MMKIDSANPFDPGDGQAPPHLSGRAGEQDTMLSALARLQARRTGGRNIVLTGPRGNGKTVLMRWFQQQAHAAGTDTVWLTPADMPDLDTLAQEAAPPAQWRQWLPQAVTVNILGAGGQLRWALGRGSGSLTRLLVARCRKTPLVMLLDETHTLGPVVGQVLLNTSQQVRAAAPFLLVMAGTPGLRARLNSMSATFWNRCEKLGIGRLDASATAQALTVPLEKDGLTLTEAALAEVIADSQGYPYFIQLWGQALWQLAQQQGYRHLAPPQVAAVRAAVTRGQRAYYADRYLELKSAGAGVLNAAATLASAFGGAPRLATRQVDAALAELAGVQLDGLEAPPAVLALTDALQAQGYIWTWPDEDDYWEPGIPSLMEHVSRKRQQFTSPAASLESSGSSE